MKLAEALSIIRNSPADSPAFVVQLACGFTPLHLASYLAAHLQNTATGRKVTVRTGLFDDLPGTVDQFAQAEPHSGALAIEWADLDPRLGFRQLGGWGPRVTTSVLDSAAAKLRRLENTIRGISAAARLAISLPTLPLPPAFHTCSWQASEAELELHALVAEFARKVASHPSVLLVNQQKLDRISPPDARYDFRADVHTGFPYTLSHADALGYALATLLQSPQPKKGLITDLDDTFWSGLVGEIGADQVSWDLTSHSQLHGLYQQLLGALADQGVLLAIASKNAPEAVNQALARADLAVARDKIFPLEVHWNAKSGSVERILRTWNISADSVVFIDDNPMELEEVKTAHPGVECLRFPKGDYPAGLALLQRLRDLFGKARIGEEDAYRLESIRRSQQFSETNDSPTAADDLLANADASITFEYDPPSSDRRVVELVNKTNQFNLNGIRYSESEWHRLVKEPGSFVIAVSYQDKFGPLGKVAVLQGKHEKSLVRVQSWVMSCRAFSRRIEYQCLLELFRQFTVGEIVLDFQPTAKNGPTQDFLSALLGDSAKGRLSRKQFDAQCPALYHKVNTLATL